MQNNMDMLFEDEEDFVWDPNNYFTPIAFVIQTQVEHHDIFKQIMMLLYQHLYKSEINRNLTIPFIYFRRFAAKSPAAKRVKPSKNSASRSEPL